MVIYKDIFISQGTSFSEKICLVDAYQNPLSITNYVIEGRMSKSYYSSTFTDLNGAILDPQNGYIQISLSSEESATLTPGRYVYEIVLIDLFENVTKIVEGMATINPGISVSNNKYVVTF